MQQIQNNGLIDVLNLGDPISMVDDATQVISVSNHANGILNVKYVTAGGAVYSAAFAVVTTNDVKVVTLLAGAAANFAAANTDDRFCLWVNAGAITLSNRTGATVTASVNGIVR